ncbi:hypothetical protein FNF31_06154 [Cafeteria roenbergensis]|uniref:RBR-type E3 ubiquitin transferase n=1 Tax=Cafeteria roenbergensis TaxID=33653 RepID=A0A5A8CPV3_CAFRO|nr:hypothetical protein FNF31_06154 [Cafeteria roenbergensis]
MTSTARTPRAWRAATTSLRLRSRVSYDVFGAQDLEDQLDALVAEFQETTATHRHAAVAVLQVCHFDVEHAKSRWFESSSSQQRLLDEACVQNVPDIPKRPAGWEGEELVDCEGCYDSVPPDEMHAAPCGHWACMECWRGHMTQQAESKMTLLLPPCIACHHRVPDGLVRAALASQPALLARWKRWHLEGLADDDKTARTCPASDCHFVCKYPKGIARDIICPSGHIFCFGCGEDGHNPASCSDAAKWRALLADDSMDLKWIQSNCRPCPKCGLTVEKNGGCQFMRCGAHAHAGVIAKGYGCGFTFCWVCMKSNEGSHSSCKPWKPAGSVGFADAELEKFVQTSAHFDLNIVGQAKTMKLLEGVRHTMLTLSTRTTLPVRKLSYLETAVHEVAEARRTIAWAYIWQHYHAEEAGSKAELFTMNKDMLHAQLNTLQGLIEGIGSDVPVSRRIAELAEETGCEVSSDSMRELISDGDRIRDLTLSVHNFREALVCEVQKCSAMLETESSGAAAAAAASSRG